MAISLDIARDLGVAKPATGWLGRRIKEEGGWIGVSTLHSSDSKRGAALLNSFRETRKVRHRWSERAPGNGNRAQQLICSHTASIPMTLAPLQERKWSMIHFHARVFFLRSPSRKAERQCVGDDRKAPASQAK